MYHYYIDETASRGFQYPMLLPQWQDTVGHPFILDYTLRWKQIYCIIHRYNQCSLDFSDWMYYYYIDETASRGFQYPMLLPQWQDYVGLQLSLRSTLERKKEKNIIITLLCSHHGISQIYVIMQLIYSCKRVYVIYLTKPLVKMRQ